MRNPGSTTLRIKIPLTLAIIPALIITCHGNRYAIPQVSLLELVRLEADQITQHIQFIKNIPVYKLRGKLLPLVYLTKELALVSGSEVNQENEAINIVVLQAGEIRFGLVVDNINDTQEIVVKPLSKLLKNLLAFSGATIMGDGKISLILDPMGLAQNAGLLSHNTQLNKHVQADKNLNDAEEKSTILLLRSGEDNLMAVLLNKVERIEEFSLEMVEKSGHQEVVQYRDSIMPLVRLKQVINNQLDVTSSEDKIQVVVCLCGDRNYGLIVDEVYDVVEGAFPLQNEISRPGVLGTAVVENKVTEFLDVENIIYTALPNYFNSISIARELP